MAANYWTSTQHRLWTYDRPTLADARRRLEDATPSADAADHGDTGGGDTGGGGGGGGGGSSGGTSTGTGTVTGVTGRDLAQQYPLPDRRLLFVYLNQRAYHTALPSSMSDAVQRSPGSAGR